MRQETVVGVIAVVALVALLSFGSSSSSSITGGAISEVGRCHYVHNPSGIFSTECDYEGPESPQFRLRPGAILFIPSDEQQGDGFGPGNAYRVRMFRQGVRDRMAVAGGTRIGVIAQWDESPVFDNEAWVQRRNGGRSFEDDGTPIIY